MPFNFSTGVYTAPNGATNAVTGQIIQSAVWNTIHTDLASALTSVGEIVLAGNSNAIWTAFSPGISSTGGTITTIAGQAGRYVQVGKIVLFDLVASITTNGSGSLTIAASLPVAAKQATWANAMMAAGASGAGKMLMGTLAAGVNSTLFITDFSAGYPGANGAVITIGGKYEAA